jgi:hypothetical protein
MRTGLDDGMGAVENSALPGLEELDVKYRMLTSRRAD